LSTANYAVERIEYNNELPQGKQHETKVDNSNPNRIVGFSVIDRSSCLLLSQAHYRFIYANKY